MMRLLLLTALTMVAFAANSVLTRMAIVSGGIDPVSFGVLRLVSGAVMLAAVCLVARGGLSLGGQGRWAGVLWLLVYLYGFSTAYLSLDAGLGALILFGMVQITMFAGGLLRSEPTPRRRWAGAALASSGLLWLLWPGGNAAVSLIHGLLMALAGGAWGLYSLAGRQSRDALQGTAANFILAAPLGLLAGLMLPGAAPAEMTGLGVTLAILCGAVTSGLGYALWYSVLPSLAASEAAVAQLTVPVIALAGGMLFLGEELSLRFALASALVLGGVAISVLPARRR